MSRCCLALQPSFTNLLLYRLIIDCFLVHSSRLQTYVLGKRPPYHQLALPNELHPLTVTAKDLSSDVPGNFETLTALVRHDYKSTGNDKSMHLQPCASCDCNFSQ